MMRTRMWSGPLRSTFGRLGLPGWVWFGIAASALWGVVLLRIWRAMEPGGLIAFTQNEPLGINEVGDFLAGAFAPLAFLWLVVAVFVQAQELSAQREELRLTRLEFQENRKVTSAQAEEARRQAEFIGTQTQIAVAQEADKEIFVFRDQILQDARIAFRPGQRVRRANFEPMEWPLDVAEAFKALCIGLQVGSLLFLDMRGQWVPVDARKPTDEQRMTLAMYASAFERLAALHKVCSASMRAHLDRVGLETAHRLIIGARDTLGS